MYAAGEDAPLVAGSTNVMSSAQDYINYCRNYNMPGLADRCDVDWDRERLVAIHLGRKMTPGYLILIDHVDIIDATRVDVSYTEVDPSGQSFVPGGARGPYVLIRIPRVCSYVTFTKHAIKDIALAQRETCTCGCKDCRCHDR
jgi:hypothetical protein